MFYQFSKVKASVSDPWVCNLHWLLFLLDVQIEKAEVDSLLNAEK